MRGDVGTNCNLSINSVPFNVMPDVIVIGGPNGAGKTTLAQTLLPEFLQVTEFVNADHIAGGLSPFKPESVALEAGRAMLRRIHNLAAAGEDFAFETTLASRSFAGFLEGLKRKGYSVTLIYVWLRSPSLAVKRVMLRVRRGGHEVPREVIVRRYHRGLENVRNFYLQVADNWYVYDNSGPRPVLVARRLTSSEPVIVTESVWKLIGG